MKLRKNLTQWMVQAFLCLSLALWSATPTPPHISAVFETLQDHREMIADHGHSHGFEEDLFWAMHGHGHDEADHDHGQTALILTSGAVLHPAPDGMWHPYPSAKEPWRMFRIDRPPRG